MYLQTVKEKIIQIRSDIKGDIPPENDPECIACLGTGMRKKTDKEMAEEKTKISLDFHKWLSDDIACECVNGKRVKYDRDVCTLSFLEKAYRAIKLPEEYEKMCFGTYIGNVDKDYFRFVEQKKIEVDGLVKRGFLFVGSIGVGKTHMAVSILNGLMLRHHLSCRYVDVSELLAELRESYNTNRMEGGFSELAIIKKYQKVPVMLFDDLSVEKTSEWVRDRIFQIMNWRYSHKLITLATSNDDTDKLIGKLGARTVSRLNALMDFVELEGPDRRGTVVASG